MRKLRQEGPKPTAVSCLSCPLAREGRAFFFFASQFEVVIYHGGEALASGVGGNASHHIHGKKREMNTGAPAPSPFDSVQFHR